MTNSELMDYVEQHPGETGNLGRLMAVKANILAGQGGAALPERWHILWDAEKLTLAGDAVSA